MKAAVITEYGNADVLQIRTDIPKPQPAPNQVLVQVKAAGINPLDWRIRNGELKGLISTRFPMVPGHDAAGIVVETGREVSAFHVGDHVFGLFDANSKPSVRGFARPGTCAAYAITREDTLAKIPKGIDFVDAAAAPLAALTAYQTLHHKAGLQANQHILINGASGGVGSFAVQIAKAAGARVTAVCGPDNQDWVTALGADQVINYRETPVADLSDEYDLFYDVIVNQSFKRIKHLLKGGGLYISNVATGATIASTLFHKVVAPLGIRQHNMHAWVMASGKDMQEIAGMMAAGTLKARIDQVFPLEKIREAHQRSESHHARGKIVVSVA